MILLFSAIVAVAIFPLEAFTSHIKHCHYPTVVRFGYTKSERGKFSKQRPKYVA